MAISRNSLRSQNSAFIDSVLKKAMQKEEPTQPEKPSEQNPQQIEQLVADLKAKAADKTFKKKQNPFGA